MFEPRTNLDKETHRFVGELQLQQYGNFIQEYHNRLSDIQDSLQNSNNIRLNPIVIKYKPEEDLSLLQLVNSDNKLLSRILASLASICEEVRLLNDEAKNNFYVPLVFYTEEGSTASENIRSVSAIIETLQKISFFVNRSRHVIMLLLNQLCSILGKGLYSGTTSTCFPEPLDCLAELLVDLLTLDSILSSDILKSHWLVYRRTVTSILRNPSQFDLPLDQLRSLDKCLAEIEVQLLSGTILQKSIDKCIEDSLNVAMKGCNLGNEFALFINYMLSELEKDDENISFTQLWLEVNALFVFYYNVFGNNDKRLYKRLCNINKKISACTIVGNVLWYPERFLQQQLPLFTKNLDIKSLASHRLNLIAIKSQNLPKEVHTLCCQTSTWITEIEIICQRDIAQFDVKQLKSSCNFLIDGLKLAKKISELIKWTTNLHADESRPMTKSVLLAVYQLVEMLKTFQFVFYRNSLPLTKIITLITQFLTHKALLILVSIKKSCTQEKSYKEQQLDVLSSLNVVQHALKGPPTDQRILVAKLGISASGLFNDNLNELRTMVNRLELITNLTNLLDRLCNCSFLYWYQTLLPLYFTKLIESRGNISRIYMVLDALSDPLAIGYDQLQSPVQKILKNDLLQPLNQLVETNLRLQTHLHLQLPRTNPFEQPPPPNFAKLHPALYGDQYVNVKAETEHYLSTIFYNLTTVVVHDWRTYGEMRRLASLQYNLNTVEDSLPMQTLDQGLDVLEIMRNIHIFVGKYMYNLNNQIFVEEKSNNKHLNTINISHVANSIRTHGIGIMNTTVNFTYQFLQKKFFIFSQFLFDEQIKSRLLKDLRFFVDHKTELNQMYPYDRAEKFNVGIRKLGLNEEGLSYLDLFRKLITQIGNAMGYVRLIRSGGRRCLADATCFIPDLKSIDSLDKILEEDLPDKVKEAMTCFKQNINNLVDNFEEATEYFKLLVNVFAPALRNPQNIHLRNFYLIIPPLTVNFVEYLLMSKENLNKKNREQAAFTDDGFAIGLAYIIELVDQTSQMKSLHWFQSVKAKNLRDRQVLEQQKIKASKEDEKLQQTLALTEKRLNAFEREFQLFFYGLNSARIFFK